MATSGFFGRGAAGIGLAAVSGKHKRDSTRHVRSSGSHDDWEPMDVAVRAVRPIGAAMGRSAAQSRRREAIALINEYVACRWLCEYCRVASSDMHRT